MKSIRFEPQLDTSTLPPQASTSTFLHFYPWAMTKNYFMSYLTSKTFILNVINYSQVIPSKEKKWRKPREVRRSKLNLGLLVHKRMIFSCKITIKITMDRNCILADFDIYALYMYNNLIKTCVFHHICVYIWV